MLTPARNSDVQHPFAEVIMQQAAAAPAVVQCLLQHYCERPPLPARAPLYMPPPPGEAGGGNTVIRFVRTAAGTFVRYPMVAVPTACLAGNLM